MNGARFVHAQLELRGWSVEIADAVKVEGFAPPARSTRSTPVLTELSRRNLLPAIWLPPPASGPSGSGPADGQRCPQIRVWLRQPAAAVAPSSHSRVPDAVVVVRRLVSPATPADSLK